MKIKALLFIVLTLLLMVVIPAINYKTHLSKKDNWREWFDKSALYNLDFALPYFNILAYKFGISTAPTQVVIGKDGWLFIGDKYAQSINNLRYGTSENSKDSAKRVAIVSNAWKAWFKSNDVKQYLVMIIADKQTVYNEFLPTWIQTAPKLLTPELLKEVNSDTYFDTTASLMTAKSNYPYPLFYKTDSHWNLLGGWVAYNDLSKKLALTNPDLKWLQEADIKIGVGEPRGTGDLGSFLWLTNKIGEHNLDVIITDQKSITVNKYNLETGAQTDYKDELRYHYSTPPVIIHSKQALNNKKVLLLVDSFGKYLSSYMSATFGETLQIHYGGLNAASLASAVETFKPDYVIAAVIERDARTGIFSEFLPATVIYNDLNTYKTHTKFHIQSLNNLIKTNGNSFEKISENDPYIFFKAYKAFKLSEAPKLLINIECKDKTNLIPIQLFWETDQFAITEKNSTRMNLKNGRNVIDLTSLSNLFSTQNMTALRLDTETKVGICKIFTINQFEFAH